MKTDFADAVFFGFFALLATKFFMPDLWHVLLHALGGG